MLFAAATPSLAANTYQNTCANVAFVYSGNNASLQAVCLRADGTPNPSSLMLQGISNQNGTLTQGSGASTFSRAAAISRSS